MAAAAARARADQAVAAARRGREAVRTRAAARLASDGLEALPWVLVSSIWSWGGCASGRLDHGWKVYEVRGGCASSRLIGNFIPFGVPIHGASMAASHSEGACALQKHQPDRSKHYKIASW